MTGRTTSLKPAPAAGYSIHVPRRDAGRRSARPASTGKQITTSKQDFRGIKLLKLS